MDKKFELKYHIEEDKNWWFVARRDAISNLIKKNFSKDSKILDIGCAGGVLVKELIDHGFVHTYGIDYSAVAIEVCKQRELKNVFVMDGQLPTFEDESFDLIIASDCLEHLEKEILALMQWKRILKKAGKLIIFVPAFNFLWSKHDEINHHYRRYTRKELLLKLNGAGFKVEKISYWNFFLFLPVLIIRKLQKFINNKEEDSIKNFSPISNRLLLNLLKVENKIFTKIRFPFGVSVFALARKS